MSRLEFVDLQLSFALSLVTMAKGIGNGFPLAAVVTTMDIAKSLPQATYFNTFGGSPLACAVGSAVLDVCRLIKQLHVFLFLSAYNQA